MSFRLLGCRSENASTIGPCPKMSMAVNGKKLTPQKAEQSRAEGHVLSKGEMMYEPPKAPRFELGNRVLAVSPTNPHRGKQGVVVEVIEPGGDNIYRYVVLFVDETSDTLFGFELQLL